VSPARLAVPLLAILCMAGCTTRTREAEGRPRCELAVLVVPEDNGVYWYEDRLLPDTVTIDGVDYGTGWGGESYYVLPGPHQVTVLYIRRTNIFNRLFNPYARLNFFFLPVGHAGVAAERGKRYVLRAEVKGVGSMAQMVHYWSSTD